MPTDKKTEVINVCLEAFIKKGLKDTTSRDLAKALNLQAGGIYYYFTSKDEAVIACAEAAAIKLETELLYPTVKEIDNLDFAISKLHKKTLEMAPYMKFFANVCSLSCYKEAIQPVLDRLAERYEEYAGKVANILNCPKEIVEPYLYMAITTVSNYMIFGGYSYIKPQIDLLKRVVRKIKEEYAQSI